MLEDYMYVPLRSEPEFVALNIVGLDLCQALKAGEGKDNCFS